MVKVIEKTEYAITLEKKFKKLEKIISNELSNSKLTSKEEFKISSNLSPNFLSIHIGLNPFLSISSNKNEMIVYNSSNYNFAYKLAEKFEKEFGEEWKLKLDYE
jgi:hypothetical protein